MKCAMAWMVLITLYLATYFSTATADTAEPAKRKCRCSNSLSEEATKTKVQNTVQELLKDPGEVQRVDSVIMIPCDGNNACDIMIESATAPYTNQYCARLRKHENGDQSEIEGCVSITHKMIPKSVVPSYCEMATKRDSTSTFKSVALCTDKDYCNLAGHLQPAGIAIALLFFSLALAFINMQ